MMTSLLRKIAILSAVGFLTSSCGGGGGGGDVAGGGLSGTGISAGAITSFGSIFVNGVEFETSSASISLDDTAVSENDLKIGMVVKVRGTFNTTSGSALTVAAEDVVKGPVQSVAGDGLSLVVLGQTVLVNNTTAIDNSIPGKLITNLNPNDLVEVHGFVKDKGIISATFIELKNALAQFHVKGFAENVNTGARTFTIGALAIAYNAADVSDLPGGHPANGQFVEVKGQNSLGVGGQLMATKVEPEGLGVADAPEAEVEGFVTSLTSTSDFFLDSQHVVTTGGTRFEGGLQSDIAFGVKLEVEGSLSGGTLTAEKVSFRDSIRLEADVATVGANSFTLKGLSGIGVTVDSQTEFKGNASAFGDIAVNDHVQVRGRLVSGNSVIASEIDETSTNTDVILQGPIDAFTTPPADSLTILGVAIDTTAIADPNFQGVDDTAIGRAAFYAGVKVGGLVKAKGTSGASVTWNEVELED